MTYRRHLIGQTLEWRAAVREGRSGRARYPEFTWRGVPAREGGAPACTNKSALPPAGAGVGARSHVLALDLPQLSVAPREGPCRQVNRD